MGLDTVELVMKVEKAFNIRIPNQEAEKISTVGDLHEAVWRQVDWSYSEGPCQSQALFYRLRQAFTENFQLPRADFKPDALMEDVFPKHNRRQAYEGFAHTIRLELPDLMLRDPWNTVITQLSITMMLIGILGVPFIGFFPKYTTFIAVTGLSGLALVLLVNYRLKSIRTTIGQKTVRDFTKKVLVLNYDKLNRMDGVHRKDMETVINHIIVDISGAEPHEITPEKKICDDLGLD
jgi:acyl carrier protein